MLPQPERGSKEVRGKRCPRCGGVSYSCRTVPPWPCLYCGQEMFDAPDEPHPSEEEKGPGRIEAMRIGLAGMELARPFLY